MQAIMTTCQPVYVVLLAAGVLAAACDKGEPVPSLLASTSAASTPAAPEPAAAAPKQLVSAAMTAARAAPMYDAATFQVDASHSSVGFSVRHFALARVHGTFDKVSGTVFLDEKSPANSAIEVSVDVASINTREPKRDRHLQSPDFFDAKKYPHMTFKSTRVERSNDGGYRVIGDLTIRGITKSVVLEVEPLSPELSSPLKTTVRGTHASAKINRKDFGLVWNVALETGGVAVSDEVSIDLELELVKQLPTAK
jgi:polyisoprenoid-binding protein YceI